MATFSVNLLSDSFDFLSLQSCNFSFICKVSTLVTRLVYQALKITLKLTKYQSRHRVVQQCTKLTLCPVEPVPHLGAGLHPSYFTCNPDLCLQSGSRGRWPKSLGPCTNEGDPEEAPDPPLWMSSARWLPFGEWSRWKSSPCKICPLIKNK